MTDQCAQARIGMVAPVAPEALDRCDVLDLDVPSGHCDLPSAPSPPGANWDVASNGDARTAHMASFARRAGLRDRAVERSYVARCIAGVDEAGRGPLAGPVVAAACVWPLDEPALEGIDDSKKLSPLRRRALFEAIQANPRVGVGIGIVSAAEIDTLNILHATMRAMRLAVEALPPEHTPDFVIVDGDRVPGGLICEAASLIKGDARCYAIAAASVVAKETRDAIMCELGQTHPEYGFAVHKGYPTAAHIAALRRHGPTGAHRRSFNPLRSWLRSPLE